MSRPHGASAPPAAATDNLRGASLMLAAVVGYAVMSALIRHLGDRYSVPQIMLFRCLVAVAPVMWLVWRAGGFGLVRTRRPGLHALRAVLGLGAMYAVFKAFAVMPLAEAIAIIFTAPLFMTALAGPLLGEAAGPRRWTAAIVGFAGALVIISPDFGSGADGAFGPANILNSLRGGAGHALAGAMLMALALVIVRRLTRTDHPASITFWFTVTGAAAAGLVAATTGFVWPEPMDLALLCLVGLAGGIAQYLTAAAFRVGEVAVVAPLEYTRLVWGALIAWLAWGETPAVNLWAGAAIVATAGLYTLHRERRRNLLHPAVGRRIRD